MNPLIGLLDQIYCINIFKINNFFWYSRVAHDKGHEAFKLFVRDKAMYLKTLENTFHGVVLLYIVEVGGLIRGALLISRPYMLAATSKVVGQQLW